MFGFVVRLDKADYQKFYREGQWGGKAQPDSMYGLCFRYCMSAVLQIALNELPTKGLSINFMVEDGHTNAGAPAEIIRQLKKKKIGGVSEHLGWAITGDKEKVPGLQAADCVTSGAWQIEKDVVPLLGNPQPPSLKNWKEFDSPHRVPILRCHIDPQHLATFKDGYFEHIAARQAYGDARQAEIAARKAARSREPSEVEP
jgi:hypothetical protein